MEARLPFSRSTYTAMNSNEQGPPMFDTQQTWYVNVNELNTEKGVHGWTRNNTKHRSEGKVAVVESGYIGVNT